MQSFTYGREYDITLAKKFLNSGDRVLILDDFLANGKAMKGLLDVCNQAGCSVAVSASASGASSRAVRSCALLVTTGQPCHHQPDE